jgi:hypothetical protein
MTTPNPNVDEHARWRNRVLRALHSLRRQQQLSDAQLRANAHGDGGSRHAGGRDKGRSSS